MGQGWGSTAAKQYEICLVDIENRAIRNGHMITEICLVPVITTENRISFMASPKLKTKSTNQYNILGAIYDQINIDNGDKVIITSIDRVATHSELPDSLLFEMSGLFDVDDDINVIRREIDAAISMDNQEVGFTVQTKSGNNSSNNNNSNNNEPQLVVADVEMDSIDALIDNSATEFPFKGKTAIEVLENADLVNMRGESVKRNVSEVSNTVSVKPIPPNTTTMERQNLYTASVSLDTIKWFAGQEGLVWSNPSIFEKTANTDSNVANRVSRPEIEWVVYTADHPMITIIKRFRDKLRVTSNEIFERKGDRSETSKWYQVDNNLVERARRYIIYVIYAQIYYTTLRNCKLVYKPQSKEHEQALLMKLANEYNLETEKRTGRVSDWPPGSYRPVVTFTLKVDYVVVANVKDSAGTLQKKTTMMYTATKK